MAETTSDFSLPRVAVANDACKRAKAIAARNSRLRLANDALFTAWYATCLAENKSDATTHRTPTPKVFASPALRAKGHSALSDFRDTFGSARASSRRFLTTAVLSLTASEPRLFRDERRLAGSGEAVTEIFAGSRGDFYAYPASTPVQVVLLLRSSVAGHFLPVEARCSDFATFECDFESPVVWLRSHCSLLSHRVVAAERPPAAFDMLRNLQTAPQRMRRPDAGHNGSVPEILLATRRSRPL
jgi:hypothetical protein